jgi:hypothetical protein
LVGEGEGDLLAAVTQAVATDNALNPAHNARGGFTPPALNNLPGSYS